METLFAGPAVDLSLPDVLWRGDFRPVEEIPPPVRHATGYALFAEQVGTDGGAPSALAADARLLGAYLLQRRDRLRASGDDLLDSAGVFLGNTLIARVPDARWQAIAAGLPEVAQGEGGGVEPFALVRFIVESDVARPPGFDEFLRHWDGHDAEQRARADAEQRAAQRLVLRDETVVPATPFRRRRGVHLVTLLDDLLEYLTSHYRATARDTPPMPHDPRTISPTVRTVRVAPQSADGAPLVIAVDAVGAIAVRAGVLHEFFFFGPDAVALEDALLSIAAGLYRETYPVTADDIAGCRLGSILDAEGFRAGGSTRALPADRSAEIAARLDALPDGWAPWPLRADLAD